VANLHRRRSVPDLVVERPGTVLRDAGQPDHGLGLYRKRRFIRRGQTAPLVNTQIMDLFGTAVWNLDLTPDGKRFAVIPRPQPTGEQKGSVHLN
jgi:hypothetical protein